VRRLAALGLLVFASHSALTLAADRSSVVAQSRTLTLRGRWDAAATMLKREIASVERCGCRETGAALRVELGRVLADRNFFHRRDAEAARGALEEALRFARSVEDEQAEADATQYLGQLLYAKAFSTRDWGTPRSEFEIAASVRERLGDSRGLSESLFYLGLTYEQEGRPAVAEENYRRSLTLSESIGDAVLQSYAYRHIGGLQEERGELEAAERNISRSLELRRAAGFTVAVPFALLQKADFVARHSGDERQVLRLLREAIDAADASRSTRALSTARLELARLYANRHRLRKALSYAECARDSARRFGDPTQIEETDGEISRIRRLEG